MVREVEALSEVIHEIFNRYGNTLKWSFLVFEWGGKTHTLIRMNDTLAQIMDAIKAYCSENQVDINDVLVRDLQGWVKQE